MSYIKIIPFYFLSRTQIMTKDCTGII